MSKEYAIETGIPMPKSTGRTGVAGALRRMNVGDSIVVPATYRTGIYTAARQIGVKVTTRMIDSEQMRVWRAA